MEKKDFIIGIDMDDTIEDLCEAWIAWLNNKYECHVNPKDIITWEIPEEFKPTEKQKRTVMFIINRIFTDDIPLLTKKQYSEFIDKYFDEAKKVQ